MKWIPNKIKDGKMNTVKIKTEYVLNGQQTNTLQVPSRGVFSPASKRP